MTNILFSDNEIRNIIFRVINKYKQGENEIFILIVEEVCLDLKARLQTTKEGLNTQDVYDTVIYIYDMYNAFIKEKNINMPEILPIFYETSYKLFVEAIKEFNKQGGQLQ